MSERKIMTNPEHLRDLAESTLAFANPESKKLWDHVARHFLLADKEIEKLKEKIEKASKML